jgi:hypothetical protein
LLRFGAVRSSLPATVAWTGSNAQNVIALPHWRDLGLYEMRAAHVESGGAEETRTPDFLLAKEALYQLSYGPQLAPGGRFWTRTRDLCLIRAVL